MRLRLWKGIHEKGQALAMTSKPDYRVPSVLHQISNQPDQSEFAQLNFTDWLAKDTSATKDWIVIARSWRTVSEDFFTFSALAVVSDQSRETILSSHRWDIDVTFGHPILSSSGVDEAMQYDSGTRQFICGVEFRPFVIYRTFHGYRPSAFELIQELLLYYEAFWEPNKREWERISRDGDLVPVARYQMDGDNKELVVDAHHLRNYLAAIRCYLVRYHDHRRKSKIDIRSRIGSEFVSRAISSDSAIYELWLRTDIPVEDFLSSSQLLGKDLVVPYSKPDHGHLVLQSDKQTRTYAAFIIDRDQDGELIEFTCDEGELSNYFEDRHTPHFLTPVYFVLEVLAKYYQEPSKYEVDASSVRCLDLWILPIDLTDEELIQVWLGDLGRLPSKEQLHWRQHNVPPRGTITKNRWRTDFLALEPEESDDPVYNFRIALEGLQDVARSQIGKGLFLPLDTKDHHAYTSLHLPVTEEWKEFDEQIQALAKILVDSVDVSLLSKITGKSIDGTDIKGSIGLLDAYLTKANLTEEERKLILFPWHMVQTLRSTGAAHRKGGKFDEALKRFGLVQRSNRDKIRAVLQHATTGLVRFTRVLQ